MRIIKYLIFLSIIPFVALAEAPEVLDKAIVIVNNSVITETELNSQITVLRQQLKLKKVELPPENVLRKQVLNHLIDVDLQLQLAKNNDMDVDSSELDNAISKIAHDNKLTVAQMRQEIEKQGISWKSYRENLRKEILIGRLQQQAVSKDIIVSNQQVDDYMKTFERSAKEQQAYHLHNIVISLPEEPTSEQVKKAKAKAENILARIKQGQDFSKMAIAESSGEYALEGGDLGERRLAELPEVFVEKVSQMNVGDVSEPIRTGNGFQLLKLVAVTGGQTSHKVSKTHVRHILLKQDANSTSEQSKNQIHNIYQQIKAGKDFAAMAKHYSLDSSSAIKGGDLGWVSSEELVPQFADAMKKLPLNVVSKPVQSPFGWHLIEVLERKTVDDTDAYQRQQVRQLLQQRKFGEAVQNWQQHLRADAYVKVLDKDLA